MRAEMNVVAYGVILSNEHSGRIFKTLQPSETQNSAAVFPRSLGKRRRPLLQNTCPQYAVHFLLAIIIIITRGIPLAGTEQYPFVDYFIIHHRPLIVPHQSVVGEWLGGVLLWFIHGSRGGIVDREIAGKGDYVRVMQPADNAPM